MPGSRPRGGHQRGPARSIAGTSCPSLDALPVKLLMPLADKRRVEAGLGGVVAGGGRGNAFLAERIDGDDPGAARLGAGLGVREARFPDGFVGETMRGLTGAFRARALHPVDAIALN